MFYRPAFLLSGISKKLPVAGSYCFRVFTVLESLHLTLF